MTRYTLQWSRPKATDRTRLTRWLDMQTYATRAEADAALVQERDHSYTAPSRGGDGLTEYRIVQRVDTPVEELDLAFDLHAADAIELVAPDLYRLPDDGQERRYVAANGHAMMNLPGRSSAFARHADDCACGLSDAAADADMRGYAGEED